MGAFDLERYLNNSRKVDLSEFDFSDAQRHSLTSDEIRCLEYMMDVESSTIVYLRALLRTCIIDDPEAVAFLSCWAYEFYYNKAQASLQAIHAQRLTSLLLKKFWTPVGSGVKRDPDVDWMIQYVFGDKAGRAVAYRIDATISRLPGLAWFNLLSYCSVGL